MLDFGPTKAAGSWKNNYFFTSQTLAAILLERYTKDIPNRIIPKNPNSNPLNGSRLKTPLIPKIPAKPNAQEEQAGAKTLLTIPVNPTPAL